MPDARVDRVHDLAGALRHLLRLLLILQAGWPCIRAGYALAAFGGSNRAKFFHGSSRQIFSGQRVLLACPVGAQLLRTASLTEAALALRVGAIARSARTGRGYDLVDECGAVLVARHNPNDFGD